MVFGIIGALDEEIRLIREQMQVDREEKVYGSTYAVGSYAGHGVVAVCCGIGTINAALCASTVLRQFGADAVINVGVAGSLCSELRVLDLVVSDELIFHDADLDTLERFYPFRRSFVADEKLRSLCVETIEGMKDRAFSYRVGRIASGDVFVESNALREDIRRRVNPLCVEMEGAAIAQTAYMDEKPFLVIRTLSDNADEGADESFHNLLDQAAHTSADLVLRMIAAWK